MGAPPQAFEPVTAPAKIDGLLRRAESAFSRGKHAIAEDTWREALVLDPDNPEALFHLGNRERERGEHRAAIARYERALVRAGGHPGVLNNLGLALEGIGEPERAEACYRAVLAAEPQHADALLNLANLCYASGRFAEAAKSHALVASIRRDVPPAVWVQRAVAQEQSGDLAGASASLEEAVRLSPTDSRIQVNLATLYLRQRRHADAEEPLLRALAHDPDQPYALSTLAYVRQHRCAWQGLGEVHERIRRLLDSSGAEGRAFNPFSLLAIPTSARQRLIAAQRWARGFAPPIPADSPRLAFAPGERLRVGFVSSDLRPHATTALLMEMWERIDHKRIETFAYATVPPDRGPTGQRIAKAFEHLVDVSRDTVASIVSRIREDRVAILIDLNGYSRFAREAIFALRPAPLQVNAFGYLGSLGAEWYDYVLTDRFVTPPEAQAHFSERFLYLDDCYCPSDTRREIAPEPGDRTVSGLPAEAFVFCCFNSIYKLLPEVFAVWMRLLAAVPNSVLWLTETLGDTGQNLRREVQAAGIDPSRLVFAPRLPLPQHLARHAHADLFLDTTPYNAGATANDALIMGLPLVTCAGETMSSRVAGSQLRAIDVPELVTNSLGDYEARALSLARNPTLLRQLRDRLRDNRHHSPLFDMSRYARGFEDSLERVWDEFRRRTAAS
jgi:predicted O-linked N-acetylglucosamine transferase (SPINDLY family)